MAKSYGKGFKYAILVSLALFCAATAAVAFSIPGFSGVKQLKPVKGVVAVPVSEVSDGEAHFFKVVQGGKEIKFFVVKGSDGALHTAFDACDACYREKKGYEQKGDRMVCRNCNMKFNVNRIGAASTGGCNPSYLPAKVDAKTVTVSVSDLLAGARFF